jgi:hypothetical protein
MVLINTKNKIIFIVFINIINKHPYLVLNHNKQRRNKYCKFKQHTKYTTNTKQNHPKNI